MASISGSSPIQALDSHTYTGNFETSWCIGSVPHGGYVTAYIMRVVSLHFSTTLSNQNQPHTIALHLEFLRRTQVGPATFVIKDTKLGRQSSIVHVTLTQDDREEIVGYITQSNLNTEIGITVDTQWKLHPVPPSTDVTALKAGNDPLWEVPVLPFADFRKATNNVKGFLPRAGQAGPLLADQWIGFRSGEKIINEDVAFFADMWPQILDNTASTKAETFWYPTLLMNLDVKKSLPAEGVDYLFVRVSAKHIKNGRYDLEVIIMDEDNELVALSHHVCLAVSASRNLAQRSKLKREGGPKI
ncbi:hypothetical protein M501DRAFT_1005574 [Patellaria atrata CBS 101060]|uniref:Thioesterase family protein n=1 Tax=Patellaria atrata CBS 101060 TaxID=1346257 RepID=A0A9P4VT88_9PEZI|nr:hypothetical protein M501DRAFT_1005574 [Patellaria atrata CBS 101060]